MNMARVIGTVWATRKTSSLEGCRLLILQPLDSHLRDTAKPIVATDSIGAGQPS